MALQFTKNSKQLLWLVVFGSLGRRLKPDSHHTSKAECISKFFTKNPEQPENEPAAAPSYSSKLTKIKKITRNDDDDFKTPKPVKKLAKIFTNPDASQPQTQTKRKYAKRGRPAKKNALQRTIEDTFKKTDVNGEHLQMAVALSMSAQEATAPVVCKDDDGCDEDDKFVPAFPSTQEVRENARKTLEQYGFKTSRSGGADVNACKNVEVSKRKKKSRYHYIKPILFLRTDEDRQEMINSKVAQILNECLGSESERKVEDTPPVHSEMLQRHLAVNRIISKNNLPVSELQSHALYVEKLNLSRCERRCGSLLKKWEDIPGRESSPVRCIDSVSETKRSSNEHSEMVNENEDEGPDNVEIVDDTKPFGNEGKDVFVLDPLSQGNPDYQNTQPPVAENLVTENVNQKCSFDDISNIEVMSNDEPSCTNNTTIKREICEESKHGTASGFHETPAEPDIKVEPEFSKSLDLKTLSQSDTRRGASPDLFDSDDEIPAIHNKLKNADEDIIEIPAVHKEFKNDDVIVGDLGVPMDLYSQKKFNQLNFDSNKDEGTKINFMGRKFDSNERKEEIKKENMCSYINEPNEKKKNEKCDEINRLDRNVNPNEIFETNTKKEGIEKKCLGANQENITERISSPEKYLFKRSQKPEPRQNSIKRTTSISTSFPVRFQNSSEDTSLTISHSSKLDVEKRSKKLDDVFSASVVSNLNTSSDDRDFSDGETTEMDTGICYYESFRENDEMLNLDNVLDVGSNSEEERIEARNIEGKTKKEQLSNVVEVLSSGEDEYNKSDDERNTRMKRKKHNRPKQGNQEEQPSICRIRNDVDKEKYLENQGDEDYKKDDHNFPNKKESEIFDNFNARSEDCNDARKESILNIDKNEETVLNNDDNFRSKKCVSRKKSKMPLETPYRFIDVKKNRTLNLRKKLQVNLQGDDEELGDEFLTQKDHQVSNVEDEFASRKDRVSEDVYEFSHQGRLKKSDVSDGTDCSEIISNLNYSRQDKSSSRKRTSSEESKQNLDCRKSPEENEEKDDAHVSPSKSKTYSNKNARMEEGQIEKFVADADRLEEMKSEVTVKTRKKRITRNSCLNRVKKTDLKNIDSTRTNKGLKKPQGCDTAISTNLSDLKHFSDTNKLQNSADSIHETGNIKKTVKRNFDATRDSTNKNKRFKKSQSSDATISTNSSDLKNFDITDTNKCFKKPRVSTDSYSQLKKIDSRSHVKNSQSTDLNENISDTKTVSNKMRSPDSKIDSDRTSLNITAHINDILNDHGASFAKDAFDRTGSFFNVQHFESSKDSVFTVTDFDDVSKPIDSKYSEFTVTDFDDISKPIGSKDSELTRLEDFDDITKPFIENRTNLEGFLHKEVEETKAKIPSNRRSKIIGGKKKTVVVVVDPLQNCSKASSEGDDEIIDLSQDLDDSESEAFLIHSKRDQYNSDDPKYLSQEIDLFLSNYKPRRMEHVSSSGSDSEDRKSLVNDSDAKSPSKKLEQVSHTMQQEIDIFLRNCIPRRMERVSSSGSESEDRRSFGNYSDAESRSKKLEQVSHTIHEESACLRKNYSDAKSPSKKLKKISPKTHEESPCLRKSRRNRVSKSLERKRAKETSDDDGTSEDDVSSKFVKHDSEIKKSGRFRNSKITSYEDGSMKSDDCTPEISTDSREPCKRSSSTLAQTASFSTALDCEVISDTKIRNANNSKNNFVKKNTSNIKNVGKSSKSTKEDPFNCIRTVSDEEKALDSIEKFLLDFKRQPSTSDAKIIPPQFLDHTMGHWVNTQESIASAENTNSKETSSTAEVEGNEEALKYFQTSTSSLVEDPLGNTNMSSEKASAGIKSTKGGFPKKKSSETVANEASENTNKVDMSAEKASIGIKSANVGFPKKKSLEAIADEGSLSSSDHYVADDTVGFKRYPNISDENSSTNFIGTQSSKKVMGRGKQLSTDNFEAANQKLTSKKTNNISNPEPSSSNLFKTGGNKKPTSRLILRSASFKTVSGNTTAKRKSSESDFPKGTLKKRPRRVERVSSSECEEIHDAINQKSNIIGENEFGKKQSTPKEDLLDKSLDKKHLLDKSPEEDDLLDNSPKKDHLLDNSPKKDHLPDKLPKEDHLPDKSTKKDHLLVKSVECETSKIETLKDLLDKSLYKNHLLDKSPNKDLLLENSPKKDHLLDKSVECEDSKIETLKKDDFLQVSKEFDFEKLRYKNSSDTEHDDSIIPIPEESNKDIEIFSKVSKEFNFENRLKNQSRSKEIQLEDKSSDSKHIKDELKVSRKFGFWKDKSSDSKHAKDELKVSKEFDFQKDQSSDSKHIEDELKVSKKFHFQKDEPEDDSSDSEHGQVSDDSRIPIPEEFSEDELPRNSEVDFDNRVGKTQSRSSVAELNCEDAIAPTLEDYGQKSKTSNAKILTKRETSFQRFDSIDSIASQDSIYISDEELNYSSVNSSAVTKASQGLDDYTTPRKRKSIFGSSEIVNGGNTSTSPGRNLMDLDRTTNKDKSYSTVGFVEDIARTIEDVNKKDAHLASTEIEDEISESIVSRKLNGKESTSKSIQDTKWKSGAPQNSRREETTGGRNSAHHATKKIAIDVNYETTLKSKTNQEEARDEKINSTTSEFKDLISKRILMPKTSYEETGTESLDRFTISTTPEKEPSINLQESSTTSQQSICIGDDDDGGIEEDSKSLGRFTTSTTSEKKSSINPSELSTTSEESICIGDDDDVCNEEDSKCLYRFTSSTTSEKKSSINPPESSTTSQENICIGDDDDGNEEDSKSVYRFSSSTTSKKKSSISPPESSTTSQESIYISDDDDDNEDDSRCNKDLSDNEDLESLDASLLNKQFPVTKRPPKKKRSRFEISDSENSDGEIKSNEGGEVMFTDLLTRFEFEIPVNNDDDVPILEIDQQFPKLVKAGHHCEETFPKRSFDEVKIQKSSSLYENKNRHGDDDDVQILGSDNEVGHSFHEENKTSQEDDVQLFETNFARDHGNEDRSTIYHLNKISESENRTGPMYEEVEDCCTTDNNFARGDENMGIGDYVKTSGNDSIRKKISHRILKESRMWTSRSTMSKPDSFFEDMFANLSERTVDNVSYGNDKSKNARNDLIRKKIFHRRLLEPIKSTSSCESRKSTPRRSSTNKPNSFFEDTFANLLEQTNVITALDNIDCNPRTEASSTNCNMDIQNDLTIFGKQKKTATQTQRLEYKNQADSVLKSWSKDNQTNNSIDYYTMDNIFATVDENVGKAPYGTSKYAGNDSIRKKISQRRLLESRQLTLRRSTMNSFFEDTFVDLSEQTNDITVVDRNVENVPYGSNTSKYAGNDLIRKKISKRRLLESTPGRSSTNKTNSFFEDTFANHLEQTNTITAIDQNIANIGSNSTTETIFKNQNNTVSRIKNRADSVFKSWKKDDPTARTNLMPKNCETNKFSADVNKISTPERYANVSEGNRTNSMSDQFSAEINNIFTPERCANISEGEVIETPNGRAVIKTGSVTPMPDYDAMDTPRLRRELAKFGVKALKRRRGVELLKYIYESTHLIVDCGEGGEDDGGGSRREVKRRRLDLGGADRGKGPEAVQDGRLHSDRIECVGDTINLGEPESDMIFEKKSSKRIPSCQLPLHIAWHNLLCANPEIRENVLLYEPLQVEVLYNMLKEQGFKYNIQDMISFLDRKCVTIRMN